MKVIVSTTINPPTKAIELFDAMPDWRLIVIGDHKTPANYTLKRGMYIGPAEQEKYDKPLSDAIGWNCIQRRNFGLLMANDLRAEVVALVDDDNIPMPNWGKDLMIGRKIEAKYYPTDLPAFDPVGATNHSELWHRGFPLQLISKRQYSRNIFGSICADVQADFWNGDPDIDAICRMEHAPHCHFDESCFPIASGRPSPFNSQNTFMAGYLLKDYFLWPGIGRMDDIWASYYLQAKGRQVIYGKASVYQDRNEHDLINDMKQEYLGYEHNLSIITNLAMNTASIFGYLPRRAIRAWELYNRHFNA